MWEKGGDFREQEEESAQDRLMRTLISRHEKKKLKSEALSGKRERMSIKPV